MAAHDDNTEAADHPNLHPLETFCLDFLLFKNASIFKLSVILPYKNSQSYTAIIYKGLELLVWYRLGRIICF